MYRTALRAAARPTARNLVRTAAPRRFASTVPADKPRSWKGSALRVGLAVAAVYYYNTSPVFAEEAAAQTVPAPAAFSQDDVPTVDSVLAEKRKQIQARPEPAAEKTEKPTQESNTDAAQTAAAEGSPAALEEEAGQQGAFNPETGEINWDCPCLGGMADGPCGEDFKTAFSCFVHSTEEPKGMDCIEKFQGMQECFKKYPEIYGAELADDDEEEGAAPEEAAQQSTPAELPSDQIPQQKEERVVITPKKAEDATDKNDVNVEDQQLVEPKKDEKKAEA